MNALIEALVRCKDVRGLAVQIGCSKDTLYNLRCGKVGVDTLRFGTVRNLCRLLKVEINNVANEPEPVR